MSLLDAARRFAEAGGWIEPDAPDPRMPSQTPLVSHIGQAMAEVPFEHMLTAIGKGIAQAQHAMDVGALKVAQLMAGFEVDGVVLGEGGRLRFGAQPGAPGGAARFTLLELGFAPTFYAFTEARVEVKVSMSMSQSLGHQRSTTDVDAHAVAGSAAAIGALAANVAMVDVRVANKYGFASDAASSVATRMVPRPAPSSLTHALDGAVRRRRVRASRVPTPAAGATLGEYVERLSALGQRFGLAGGATYSPRIHGSVTGFTVEPGPDRSIDPERDAITITLPP